MTFEIHLEPYEIIVARTVGRLRYERATVGGYHANYASAEADEDQRKTFNINGAAGEMAAAKCLGAYWPPSIDTFHTLADIPPDWEVRTRSGRWDDLCITPSDDDAARVILVTGKLPDYQIHGWIRAGDGKQDQWLGRSGRGQVYYVPASFLHPMP